MPRLWPAIALPMCHCTHRTALNAQAAPSALDLAGQRSRKAPKRLFSEHGSKEHGHVEDENRSVATAAPTFPSYRQGRRQPDQGALEGHQSQSDGPEDHYPEAPLQPAVDQDRQSLLLFDPRSTDALLFGIIKPQARRSTTQLQDVDAARKDRLRAFRPCQ
jgi:hypothetical protein